MNLANQFVKCFKTDDKNTIRKLIKKYRRKFPATCLEAEIQLFFEEQKFKQALSKIDEYEALVEITKMPPGSMLVFAQILLSEKKPKRSLKYLKRVIELDPKGKTAPELMFWLFFNESDYGNADLVLEKLITVDPEEKQYLVWKLILKASEENFAEVLSLFELIRPIYNHDMHRFDEVTHGVFHAFLYLKSPNDLKELVNEYQIFQNKSLNVRMCEPSYFFAMRDLDGALKAFDSIVKDFPDRAEPRWNRALALLSKGEIQYGFDEYESRWSWAKFPSPRRKFDVPSWNGEPLDGKRILVWAEQGLGDEIMFLTLLNHLVALNPGGIVVEVSNKIVQIVKDWYPRVTVRPSGPENCIEHSEYVDFDFQIASGSLCKHFGTQLISDEHHHGRQLLVQPHLRDRDSLTGNWASNYDYLVGLAWRSGRLSTARNTAYINHRLALKLNDELPSNVGIVALQYGLTALEKEELDRHKRIFVPQVEFFDEVYLQNEFVAACDFLVTPHTILFHLAGIQGKPILSWLDALAWTRLGQQKYPWYENVVHCYTEGVTSKANLAMVLGKKANAIFSEINGPQETH